MFSSGSLANRSCGDSTIVMSCSGRLTVEALTCGQLELGPHHVCDIWLISRSVVLESYHPSTP
jgi:hypothetical protein